ncbi:MAG TPA: FAD-dependent oxidoreductase, partial [Solirubrobacterales bacterium]|nr:FAD-dependent oxidoreductase [Solirubrobacterales bacterium]
EDWTGTREFVAQRLRGVTPEPARAKVCMYTNSPDEHFVLGPHPDLEGALVVSACSGHGFKFAPVLGEVAVRLSLGEEVPYDLDTFSLRRLAGIS